MITEDYVSFEVASLLKDKGFSQKMKNSGYFATEMVYGITELEDGTHHLCHQYPACYNFDNHICAPTLQMAMKWLRETYHIFIRIIQSHIEYCTYEIYYNHGDFYTPRMYYNTYEEACEEGIKHCLEKLI